MLGWRYLSVALLLAVPIVNGGDCGPKFKNKCSCGKGEYIDRIQYIVNCTNSGFRETSMLEHLPPQTEVLIWTGNYVPELPWNVFGAINDLPNLTIVDMSSNHIREIRGKSYHHVPNVKRLILNHNNLSISSDDDDDVNHHHPRVFSNFVNLMELHLTNAFSDNTSMALSEDLHDIFMNSNLTKLTKLHLEQNEIRKFKDKRVFCDLPSLRDLHLGDNFLEELNFNVVCLTNLRFLDLERNKFTQMKLKDLNLLDILSKAQGRDTELIMDLTYNHLACDCTINNIQDWLKKTKVKIRNLGNLFCYKDGRPYQPLLSVKYNKCRVQSRNSTTTRGHTITLVFLFVAFCTVLLSLVTVLVYINRNRIKKIVNPVMTNVSRKVQYTTIKDDDAPEQYV
jgi:Leucine rich repeat